MNLHNNFQFNQGCLQDFVDCKRRFYLKYIQRITWPAIESEPVLDNERRERRGQFFHRLLQQSQMGIPREYLEMSIQETELEHWWKNYIESDMVQFIGNSYPEISLTAHIRSFSLGAKYDLVALTSDKSIMIIDWKTYQKHPGRAWFSNRLQTRVYPYVMVRAGSHINEGKQIEPEQIQMIYWLANFPQRAEKFTYNVKQYEEDDAYVDSLINLIQSHDTDDFVKTTNEKLCGYCCYRSLCERGISAQHIDLQSEIIENDIGQDISIDFEQIAEIEY